jgi:hypothetical protein
VVEHGYGPAPPLGRPSAHAFFPLYPGLVRIASDAFRLEPFRAGILLSAVLALSAGVLFLYEGRRRLGETGARRALVFLLLFPTSFFLLAMYAESLFLLLALASFAALSRGRARSSAALAFLAGWTRAHALALALPLAITAWRQPGLDALRPRGRAARAVLIGLAPVVGVLSWLVLLGWISGDPFVYFHAQTAWRRGHSPMTGLWEFAGGLPQRLARGDARSHPAFLLDYAYAALFAGIALFQARRRLWSDAAWTAGALLLPVATGVALSIPRYLLVVYPAFYALAQFFDGKPRWERIWWAVSAGLLLAGTAAFVHWRWVA